MLHIPAPPHVVADRVLVVHVEVDGVVFRLLWAPPVSASVVDAQGRVVARLRPAQA